MENNKTPKFVRKLVPPLFVKTMELYDQLHFYLLYRIKYILPCDIVVHVSGSVPSLFDRDVAQYPTETVYYDRTTLFLV